MKPIKVLLADDHAIVRMGLASLLGTQSDIDVVGEAEDGEDAVRSSPPQQPTTVVGNIGHLV